MKGKITILVLAGIVALSGTGCVDRKAQAQAKRTETLVSDPVKPVTAELVATEDIKATLDITGALTTSTDSVIGAKVTGRLVSVMVKDGDPVSSGQVIAVQDTVNQQMNLQQALAAVDTARSSLAQAMANLSIGPMKSASAVKSAEAQLRSAKAQLSKSESGARTEEKRQADSQVASAKSNLETTKSNLERTKKLVDEGAIAASKLEAAQNAYQAALSAYEQALEAKQLTDNRTRPEDLMTAHEAVRQAEEAVRTAQAQQSLDVLFKQQVESAKAQMRAANAQRELAVQAIADATIRSPFAGRISGNPMQVGTMLSPGGTVARVVGTEGMYFEGQVNEVNIDLVKVGTTVSITVDAAADKTFQGIVAAIAPAGESVGRLFRIRVQLAGALEGLRPGMFARGQITKQEVKGAVVVPVDCVVQKGADSYVFIVAEDAKGAQTAKRVKVNPGIRTAKTVQVDGVKVGDKVITEGQENLDDGAKVKTRAAKVAMNDPMSIGG